MLRLKLTLLGLVACFCVPASPALAGRNADLKPILAKPRKVLADESFSANALSSSWRIAKGDWQVRDGTLVGKEKKEDNHPAVCILNIPNQDSLLRFSFKLEGVDGFAVSLNDAKGHLFRVNVSKGSITIHQDKDKKDAASKPVELAKGELKLEQGQWSTMLLEIQGGKVAVQVDNGAKVEANAAALAVPKTGYRFVTHGESLVLADVKAWEAQP